MISKQLVLGSVLLLGGAVTLFAMSQNNKPEAPPAESTTANAPQNEVARPVAVPLTTDVATEEKILAQKQKQREAHNQQMAKEVETLLKEQEQARMLALDKAKQEINPTTGVQISADNAAKSELIAVPSVQTRPESIEAARQAEEQKRLAEQKAAEEKAQKEQKNKPEDKTDKSRAPQNKTTEKTQEQKPAKPETKAPTKAGEHKVASGDSLVRLSRQYGVPVSALAEANNMGRNDALVLGRTIKIPSQSQVARLERDAAARENKKQANTKKEKKEQPKTDNKTQDKSDNKSNDTKKSTGATYSVQVALSPDKEKVDEIVKKYRAAGYSVSTSQTSRGTRVLIGSAKSYDEANSLRQKMAQDSRVDSNGAWVKKMEQ